MTSEAQADRTLDNARALITDLGAPEASNVREALDVGWPLPRKDAPAHQRLAAHLGRARACTALVHEAASGHRWLERRYGNVPAVSHAEAPAPAAGSSTPAPFEVASAQARDALHADPVWRAAVHILHRPAGAPEQLLAHCQAWRDHLEAPLKHLRAEQAAAQGLEPGQERRAPVHLLRSPDGGAASHGDLSAYASAANRAAATRLGHSPRDDKGPPQLFRAASEADRHVEFQALLIRSIKGREFQVLRPLSGDQTLVLAYSSDLRPSPSSSQTVRLQPPRRLEQVRRDRGVDR